MTSQRAPPLAQILETTWNGHVGQPASQHALDVLDAASAHMGAQALAAWRWRILHLRATIDAVAFNGTSSSANQRVLNASFAELDAIYYVERNCSNFVSLGGGAGVLHAGGAAAGVAAGAAGAGAGADGLVPMHNCTILALRPGFPSGWPKQHPGEC